MMRRAPLLAVAAAFAGGILLRERLVFGFPVFAVFATGGLAAAALLARSRAAPPVLFTALFLLGAARAAALADLPPAHLYHHIHHVYGDTVLAEGVIVGTPRQLEQYRGPVTRFVLDLEAVRRSGPGERWRAVSGRVLVNLYRHEGMRRGDRVLIGGKLHSPYDFSRGRRFSYSRYLRRRGIRFIISVKKDGRAVVLARDRRSPLRCAANWAAARLEDRLPPVEAAVMRAVLLGRREGVPDGMRDRFRRIGTAHVLAISGLHVGIITALIFLVLGLLRVPLCPRYLLTALAVAAYAGLTGGRPSVTRAAVMAGIFLSGFALERESDGMNALALAALILLAHNPNDLFAPGFQLSFAAVSAIVLFYPPVRARMERAGRWPKRGPLNWLAQSALVSAAAWAGVAGLIAWHFGIISPVNLPANLVIVPLITGAVALGTGLVLLPPVPAWIWRSFADSVVIGMTLIDGAARFFDRWPGTPLRLGGVPGWAVGVYYGVLVLIGLWVQKVKSDR